MVKGYEYYIQGKKSNIDVYHKGCQETSICMPHSGVPSGLPLALHGALSKTKIWTQYIVHAIVFK